MGYKQELDALGRWVYQTAGLTSYRLDSSPPQLARPVILWESPNSVKGQNLGNYAYLKRRSQFGKLYVNSVDQLAEIMDKLEQRLADLHDYLIVYESDQADALPIGRMIRVQFEVGTSTTLDIPITVRYDVIQDRTRPIEPPPATTVTTASEYGGGTTDGNSI